MMSPLQTIAKEHEERVAALEAVQKTAQKQALAARVFPWKSLLHLQSSADVEEETSWLSSVSARLESIEFWIAAM